MIAPSAQVPDPTRRVTVLLISPDSRDHTLLRHVFHHSNWALYECRTVEDGLRFLALHPMPVVITEERLGAADWKEVLSATNDLPKPAKLIVTSHHADSALWAEVINLGGYDVLAKPWNERELFHAISQAWLAWKHEADRPVKPAGEPPQYRQAAV
jgi:DNA-binding NtrC family response regulator